MKKDVVFLLLCMIYVLSGCKGDTNSSIVSGNYVMELSQEQKENEKIAPIVIIDAEQNSFLFSYDALSSYLSIGTYEINGTVLTATTQDEKYHYVFDIVDENTLSFVEQESSKITVFDNHFGVVPQDGAIFQKEEQQ